MQNKKKPILYAFVAASLFGASAPLAKLLLFEIHPVLLASFLYLGSGLGLLFYKNILRIGQKGINQEAKLNKADLPWLMGAIISGGVAAPIVLLVSLKHTPAATASLILNFEGVATVLIAALFFKEAVSRRIMLAVTFITIAVIFLSVNQPDKWGLSLWALGVSAACALWGLDNNFTRNISAKDPVTIVIVKGLMAGTLSLVLAFMIGTPFPGMVKMLLSFVLGFFCYGISIVFFILSMRELGAARTSAYFATAPFIGAALSGMIFRESPNVLFYAALPFIAVGAFLLYTEKHSHLHNHFALEHDHIHNHLDEHHDHKHQEGICAKAHTHAHQHPFVKHKHPHNPDVHHRHDHN